MFIKQTRQLKSISTKDYTAVGIYIYIDGFFVHSVKRCVGEAFAEKGVLNN